MIDICDIQDKTNIINKIARSIEADSIVNPVPTRHFMKNSDEKIIIISITKDEVTVNIVFDIENETWFLATPNGRQQVGKKFDLNINNQDFEIKLNFLKLLF